MDEVAGLQETLREGFQVVQVSMPRGGWPVHGAEIGDDRVLKPFVANRQGEPELQVAVNLSPGCNAKSMPPCFCRICRELAQSGLASAILHAENQGVGDITLAEDEACWVVEASRDIELLGLGYC